MELVIWIVVVGGMLFMVWYGYTLLAKRPGSGVDGGEPEIACRICSRAFPVGSMVARERIAGIVDYFCGECIESLHAEHLERRREGPPVSDVGSISRN
jgi:hypothetical protein